MLPPLRNSHTNLTHSQLTSRQSTPSSSRTVDNKLDRVPETQLQPIHKEMVPASLPTTQEGLITLQA